MHFISATVKQTPHLEHDANTAKGLLAV